MIMIRVPQELQPYISWKDGKMIPVNLPDELKDDFEKFKKEHEKLQKENPLSDF